MKLALLLASMALGCIFHMVLEMTLVITRSERPFRIIVVHRIAPGRASDEYVDAFSVFQNLDTWYKSIISDLLISAGKSWTYF